MCKGVLYTKIPPSRTPSRALQSTLLVVGRLYGDLSSFDIKQTSNKIFQATINAALENSNAFSKVSQAYHTSIDIL